MKLASIVARCAAGAALAAILIYEAAGCTLAYQLTPLGEVPFDGSSLGTCSADASMVIPATDCPVLCPGASAIALCTGTSYGLCSCVVPPAPPGSPCGTGSEVVACKGKVALAEPSEGQCDKPVGYLLCDGKCYASFVCDLPAGYKVVGGADGGNDAADAVADAATDQDAAADGPADAPVDARGESAAPDGSKDAGAKDGGPG